MSNTVLDQLAILAKDARPNSRVGLALRGQGVRAGEEFRRIDALPRRVWSDQDAVALALEMTPLLRQPGSKAQLRPIQAVALLEIGMYGGLLGPLRAGAGKTLISLLAPYVLAARRPVILLPAKLRDRTYDWMRELLRDWRIAYWVHLVSYESLGRVSRADFLTDLGADMVIADEAHKLKNPRAACTRRVKRYLEAAAVPYVDMSGTIMKRSLHEITNRAKWALVDGSPVPRKWHEAEEWASATDERPRAAVRMAPGALVTWASSHRLADVREGLQRRITQTPGVVATFDQLVGVSLIVTRVETPECPHINQGFETLRKKGETPDGYPTLGGLDDARHAKEMALGFFYRWNPRGPDEWLTRRREWGAFVRYVLAHNRSGIDSEMQVAQWVDRGKIDCPHVAQECGIHPDARDRWREIRDTFVPNKEAVWISEVPLARCAEWLHKGPGILWTEHVSFAERLSEYARVPYAGAGGLTRDGTYIEKLTGPVIASIASNSEGRNLQDTWSQNMVSCPPSLGAAWEQMLARTHRDGQPADEVTCDALSGCRENDSSFAQARRDAEFIGRETGQEQRLSYGTIMWGPPETRGARWG